MNPNKRCIVNFFSSGRENYQKGSERLILTILKQKLDIDVHIFSPQFIKPFVETIENTTLYTYPGYPINNLYGECKPHKEEPYQFKSYAIQTMREMGYESILWCDSSIMLFKNPEHYFELSKEIGVILFDNPGCTEATWTADDCLNQMGCNPVYANTFFECDAGMMLFNFSVPVTHKVFDEYIKYCNDGICLNGKSGSTRPEFKAHRHDQSIISYIAKKNNITLLSYGAWCYGHEVQKGLFHPTLAKVGII
jgi:hypothetical protein